MKVLNKDRATTLWIIMGLAILISYFVFCFVIGGSALNGYVKDGRYFVTEHENVTEVSKEIWIASKISGVLFYVFIPLTPLGAFAVYDIFEKIEHRKAEH
ncbi:MAG: hypothetical protein MJ132_04895 [Clostridia bacterium]|nr:hypothetical protein [Clostridia bacterium]